MKRGLDQKPLEVYNHMNSLCRRANFQEERRSWKITFTKLAFLLVYIKLNKVT